MANGQVFRPTLLVGLGGTGCRIAENVYTRAPASGADLQGRIQVIGFDSSCFGSFGDGLDALLVQIHLLEITILVLFRCPMHLQLADDKLLVLVRFIDFNFGAIYGKFVDRSGGDGGCKAICLGGRGR